MSNSQILKLSKVSKSYQKGRSRISIFDNLDFSVDRGSFTSIMGPSGSGKSTLLNLIGGLDSCDSGEIQVCGHSLQNMNESALARWRALHVGFVFQFYNLLPMLNAAQNVGLPLLLTGNKKKSSQERVKSMLNLVGLGERLDHKPEELSGGQLQRVGIARALIADPDLLLCDEPTGDLDRETADSILDLLSTLSTKYGKTIIMVTHDPVAARRADRQIHAEKGTFSEEPAYV